MFWKEEASTVTVPSCSVRVSVRLPSSQVISRPWRSRVLPSGWPAGLRKVATAPVISSQRSKRVVGDVGEQQVAPVAVVGRPLGEAKAGGDALDGGHRHHQMAETRVEHDDIGIGIADRRRGFPARRIGAHFCFPSFQSRNADCGRRRPLVTVVLYCPVVKQRGNAMPMPAETDTTSPKYLRDKYAIVGVGETTYTRGSGMTTRARHLGGAQRHRGCRPEGVRRRRHVVLPVAAIRPSRPSSPATSGSGSTSTWTCSAAARRPRR